MSDKQISDSKIDIVGRREFLQYCFEGALALGAGALLSGCGTGQPKPTTTPISADDESTQVPERLEDFLNEVYLLENLKIATTVVQDVYTDDSKRNLRTATVLNPFASGTIVPVVHRKDLGIQLPIYLVLVIDPTPGVREYVSRTRIEALTHWVPVIVDEQGDSMIITDEELVANILSDTSEKNRGYSLTVGDNENANLFSSLQGALGKIAPQVYENAQPTSNWYVNVHLLGSEKHMARDVVIKQSIE